MTDPKSPNTADRWENEKKAVRAVQVAFDVGDEVNQRIRLEAAEQGINPPDRVRQILGLPSNRKPQRPRLTISLTEEDFRLLAERFSVDVDDRLKIRQVAAERLIRHLNEAGAD